MTKYYYVYILTNFQKTTFYIGVTSDLLNRVKQHKDKVTPGFTSRYNLNRLVYFEQTDGVEGAIMREKQLKNWRRQWKLALITKSNPTFKDLFDELAGAESR